jgi:predicted cobalt transporter CbtA
MVGNLLLRGMIVGVVAGLLAFAFARAFGEPQVDLAIAFEEQMSKAEAPTQGAAAEPEEPELVSRETQAGIGLLTGIVVYGAAVGGLFALVFACLYGRLGRLGPRETAALLALGAFLAVVLVPFLKYPPNPPAVGNDETIATRTELYFIMLIVSLATLALGVAIARSLWDRYGGFNAGAAGGAVALVVIIAAFYLLPDINEMPDNFSAMVIWRFRMASLGIHAIMWTTMGLLFGLLTERSLAERSGRAFTTRAAALN